MAGNSKQASRFQLTAARRRLVLPFQHIQPRTFRFNSQPPEGGWFSPRSKTRKCPWFQLTAARRRLGVYFCCRISARGFNSQPPEGGWF